MTLSDKNIESELSYAYLHAVASRAGMDCNIASRHSDNIGVDARIYARGNFGGHMTDFTIEVQLKATILEPVEQNGALSYPLKKKNYDDLRKIDVQSQRILVVLFMPQDPMIWLRQSEEELALLRCAYWVSLRGAPESDNDTGQTVYIPKTNILSVDALKTIASANSREEWIPYESRL